MAKPLKYANFDKLQSAENHIFYSVIGFLGSNCENIALSKDFRIVRYIKIETSLFCSNQMKIQEIDHSVTAFFRLVGLQNEI